nr:oxidation resistance protein 1-like isoform X3 [Rhipicephalus microplus]
MDMFLNISSRHITDGKGVVMGTLLVTPNNVMFVPNVSDPLVMEHGSECYEVTAPMDMVVAAAIYNDITHMHVRDTPDAAAGIQWEEPYQPAHHRLPPKGQASVSEKMSEPVKSSQEYTTEASPVPSTQGANEKPSSDLSCTEQILEARPGQMASTENKVIIISQFKKQEEGLPSNCRVNSKMTEPNVQTLNRAPATVSSNVCVPECKPPKEVHDTFSADTVVKSNSLEQEQQQDTKQTLLLGSDVQKPKAVVESTEQSDAQLRSSDKFTSKKGPYSEPHNEEVCALQANKYSSLEATTTLLGKVELGVRSSAAKKLAADVGPVPDACKKTAKASAEVVKDDRAGDKLATKHIETLTNLQERLPTDSATPQKILAMEESAAAKEIERETADEYLLKPINRASESQPTVRGEPNSGGCWEKESTLPPLSLGGKSLPEPSCLSCMPSSTLELSSTNHVPATELSRVASTESIPVCMREWASVDDGVPSDRSQEPAHEQVLKELSSPVELISLSTHSISKTIASSPKLEANFLHSVDDPVPLTPTLQLQTQQLAADEKRPSLQTGNANVWLKNMVEEKPELFAAFDKLVPRLAQSSEATLLYLCLRMGRPLHKNQCSATASSKRCIRSQYWFGIPRNRADELYYFLEKWAPSVYGDVHRVDMASRGFEPLLEPADEDEAEMHTVQSHILGTISRQGGQDTPDMSSSSKGHHGSKKGHGGALRFFKLFGSGTTPPEAAAASPSDWEVALGSETRKVSPIDLTDLPLPELLDSTEIFTEEHRRELCKHLPARAESYSWALVYSTLKHGFSLKTLYREMLKTESPILLTVLDTEGAVFGVLTSCSLRMCEHFYGTGESFLFTFHPEFKLYKWTGENVYFIKGNADFLAFGAGEERRISKNRSVAFVLLQQLTCFKSNKPRMTRCL